MRYNTTILPAAKSDLYAVYNWYEAQKPALGGEFINAVIKLAEELEDSVITHRFFFQPVRYLKMKRFPYTIFYLKDELYKRIVIVGILGNKQKMLDIVKKRVG
jgi:hypothetical protein